jgi:hypothetical protein
MSGNASRAGPGRGKCAARAAFAPRAAFMATSLRWAVTVWHVFVSSLGHNVLTGIHSDYLTTNKHSVNILTLVVFFYFLSSALRAQ